MSLHVQSGLGAVCLRILPLPLPLVMFTIDDCMLQDDTKPPPIPADKQKLFEGFEFNTVLNGEVGPLSPL